MYQLETLILDRIKWSYLSLEFSLCEIFNINLISLTDTAPFRYFFPLISVFGKLHLSRGCFISVVKFIGMKLLVLQTADADKSVYMSQ